MKFTTASGSVYEINTDSKQIRRLNGNAGPTSRQGKDGDWRKYIDILPNPVKVGSPLLIAWGDDVELLPETKATGMAAMPTTVTSAIVSIEE